MARPSPPAPTGCPGSTSCGHSMIRTATGAASGAWPDASHAVRAAVAASSTAAARGRAARRASRATAPDAGRGERPGAVRGPLVAICMATYEPPSHLFDARSSRSAPRPTRLGLPDQRRLLEPGARRGDARRRRRRPAVRRLALASPARLLPQLRARARDGARRRRRYVALADQDDALASGQAGDAARRELGRAQLVYSDARIVDRDGAVIAETYWSQRAQQPLRPALAADRQRGDRRGVAVPTRAARDALPFPRASSRSSTTTGSR